MPKNKLNKLLILGSLSAAGLVGLIALPAWATSYPLEATAFGGWNASNEAGKEGVRIQLFYDNVLTSNWSPTTDPATKTNYPARTKDTTATKFTVNDLATTVECTGPSITTTNERINLHISNINTEAEDLACTVEIPGGPFTMNVYSNVDNTSVKVTEYKAVGNGFEESGTLSYSGIPASTWTNPREQLHEAQSDYTHAKITAGGYSCAFESGSTQVENRAVVNVTVDKDAKKCILGSPETVIILTSDDLKTDAESKMAYIIDLEDENPACFVFDDQRDIHNLAEYSIPRKGGACATVPAHLAAFAAQYHVGCTFKPGDFDYQAINSEIQQIEVTGNLLKELQNLACNMEEVN